MCEATTGEVIGLDLNCSRLEGQLSSNNNRFLLQHLQILNLAHNDFNYSEISPKFSQLRRLTHLNLSNSYFSREVPTEISYLSNLVSLDLSDFSRCIGGLMLKIVTMKSLVQNLTSLKVLNLDNVDLSLVGSDSLKNISSFFTSLVLARLNGIFPTNIFHLPNLQLLRLSSGPDLQVSNWNITSLMELHFFQINLKSGLPSSIGNLNSLKYLDISLCGMSGWIPNSIGNLTNLEYLDLSFNNLVGSIPLYMYSHPLLCVLDLSNNQFIGGQLHSFQSRVVETISLQACGLQGHVPTLLFPHGANQLTTLDLGHNSLNGTIPSSLFSLPSTLLLSLDYNQLVGGIPEFISQFLVQIKLSDNKLQGNVPSSISGLAL